MFNCKLYFNSAHFNQTWRNEFCKFSFAVLLWTFSLFSIHIFAAIDWCWLKIIIAKLTRAKFFFFFAIHAFEDERKISRFLDNVRSVWTHFQYNSHLMLCNIMPQNCTHVKKIKPVSLRGIMMLMLSLKMIDKRPLSTRLNHILTFESHFFDSHEVNISVMIV